MHSMQQIRSIRRILHNYIPHLMKQFFVFLALLSTWQLSLAQRLVDSTYDYYSNRLLRYGKFDLACPCWRLYDLQPNGKTASITKLDTVNFQPLDSMIAYYSSDQVAFVLPYKKGYIWGDFVAYHPSGQVKQTGAYYRGFKSGRWVEFHPNGRMQSESFYSLSREDSTFQDSLTFQHFDRSYAIVEKLVYGEPDSVKAMTPGHGYNRITYEFKVLTPAKTGTWKQYNEKGRVISKFKYGRRVKTNSE